MTARVNEIEQGGGAYELHLGRRSSDSGGDAASVTWEVLATAADQALLAMWLRTAPTDAIALVVRCPVRVRGRAAEGQPSLRLSGIVVVTREGAQASMSDATSPQRRIDLHHPTAVWGSLVDTMMRFMGLATVPDPRGVNHLVSAMWCDRLVAQVFDEGPYRISAARALALHPLVDPDSPPSADAEGVATVIGLVESLVHATSWERLRSLCMASYCQFGQVAPAEAQWMDEPMFARSLMADYPPVLESLDYLNGAIDESTLDVVRAVLAGTA